MAWHKPANKLISFWFAGLPTLVSDTPAYVELMNEAKTNMYCGNTGDWVSMIEKIMKLSTDERKSIAEKNLSFVKKDYSNDAITENWKEILELLVEL